MPNIFVCIVGAGVTFRPAFTFQGTFQSCQSSTAIGQHELLDERQKCEAQAVLGAVDSTVARINPIQWLMIRVSAVMTHTFTTAALLVCLSSASFPIHPIFSNGAIPSSKEGVDLTCLMHPHPRHIDLFHSALCLHWHQSGKLQEKGCILPGGYPPQSPLCLWILLILLRFRALLLAWEAWGVLNHSYEAWWS